MLIRAFLFGCIGLAIEVLWTGLNARLRFGNTHYEGCSYAWMLPCYGFGGLLFDGLRVYAKSSDVGEGWLIPIYVVLIFMLEAIYGSFLKMMLGGIPWEYRTGWHWRGLVKWSYLPLWLVVAIFFNTLARHVS